MPRSWACSAMIWVGHDDDDDDGDDDCALLVSVVGRGADSILIMHDDTIICHAPLTLIN